MAEEVKADTLSAALEETIRIVSVHWQEWLGYAKVQTRVTVGANIVHELASSFKADGGIF